MYVCIYIYIISRTIYVYILYCICVCMIYIYIYITILYVKPDQCNKRVSIQNDPMQPPPSCGKTPFGLRLAHKLNGDFPSVGSSPRKGFLHGKRWVVEQGKKKRSFGRGTTLRGLILTISRRVGCNNKKYLKGFLQFLQTQTLSLKTPQKSYVIWRIEFRFLKNRSKKQNKII